MFHYRKNRNSYNKKLKTTRAKGGCSFCTDPELAAKAVLTTEFAYVIPNRISYDTWEGHPVGEHLLAIPKQHVAHLSELADDANLDIINVMATYEFIGYNIYARAVNSPRRSVEHQHTHLIKFADAPRAKFSLYVEKPYLLIDSHILEHPRQIIKKVLLFKRKSTAHTANNSHHKH